VPGTSVDDPLVLVSPGLQSFAQAAEPVLLRQDASGTEHGASAQGGDPAVVVQPGSACAEQGV
jgi:hypothetical protein